MIWFAYFASAVGLSYWVGRSNTGLGVAAFFVAVALWQLVVDGPSSFLDNDGCQRYSNIAQDC